jgi:hypothetical protein
MRRLSNRAKQRHERLDALLIVRSKGDRRCHLGIRTQLTDQYLGHTAEVVVVDTA